jgi:hypothetical protein
VLDDARTRIDAIRVAYAEVERELRALRPAR